MAAIPIPSEQPGSEPQPPLKQPSKRKVDTKVLAIILLVIVFVSILGGLTYVYINLDKRFNKLTSDYNTLKTNYNALQAEHEDLTASYQTLNNQYTTLNNKYTTLNTQYTSLSQDYNELSQVFNSPLSYETIPTTTQLKQWLASDNTDSIYYRSPNFICGDFSVMLSQHAKLKHWDIGIVEVWGYTETYQSYAHAFNAIITAEGLVYIEPQNDHYWWYSGHKSIYEGLWWEIDDDWIYVQEYNVVVSYS